MTENRRDELMLKKEQKRMQNRAKKRVRLIAFIFVTAIFMLGALLGYAAGRMTDAGAQTCAAQEAKSTVYDIEISSCGRVLDNGLKAVMIEACEEYNVPFALAVAVAEQESRFDPNAKSRTGDHGMMQINKSNFSWLRKLGIEPLDKKGNIIAGVLMLSEALSRCNTVNEALMVYNRGAAGAKRLWKKGIYSTEYSRQTMERYDKWDRILK